MSNTTRLAPRSSARVPERTKPTSSPPSPYYVGQRARTLATWLHIPWAVVGQWADDYREWQQGANVWPLRGTLLAELFFGLVGVVAELAFSLTLVLGLCRFIGWMGHTALVLPSTLRLSMYAGICIVAYMISMAAVCLIILFTERPRPMWNA